MSSSATGRSGPQIGYCHTCDRQVEIDPVSFECNRCHGGFIEIFDIEQQQQQQQQTQQTPGGAQARVIRLNNQNFGDVLPLFLQMLAQGGGGGAGGGQMPPMFSAGLGGAGARMPGDAESASATDSLSSDSGGAGFNMRPGTTTTRLQVLVPSRPNEAGQDQFDLYGVINNVINDLLDPRRTGQATGQNSFHFQAPPIRIINLHSDARDYAWGAGGLDAIITQLLNQLENTGPPPASQDQLHNLPVITISQEQVDTNVQCAICMEDFALNEKAKKLPCKHLFHEPCITEWLKLHGTCPVCRKNLNGEDTSQREYISRPPPGNNNNNNNDDDSNNSSGATSSGSGGGGGGEGEGSSNAAASSQQPAQDSTSSNPHPNPSRSRDNNFYDADFD